MRTYHMAKIGTKSTSFFKFPKKPHISEIPNIDPLLRKLSTELFDLDAISRLILVKIGRNGPQNEYDIWKTMPDNTPRRTIGRRINDPKGLLQRGFIYESTGKKLRTEQLERPFVLTLKGFIASLAKTKFEQNFLIELYKQYVEKFADPKFAEFALIYAKFNLAVILYWHKLNGLSLTSMNNTMNYLSDFNYRQLYDALPINAAYVKDYRHIDEFLDLRQYFMSLQIAMARLLQIVEKDYSFGPYEIFGTNKELQLYYSKELLYSIVKGWMHCLEFPEYLDPATVLLRTKPDQIKKINIDLANDVSDKLLNSMLGLKNTKKYPISII